MKAWHLTVTAEIRARTIDGVSQRPELGSWSTIRDVTRVDGTIRQVEEVEAFRKTEAKVMVGPRFEIAIGHRSEVLSPEDQGALGRALCDAADGSGALLGISTIGPLASEASEAL